MLCPSFDFQSTKQQYTSPTLVPAESTRIHEKPGGESVHKLVQTAATRRMSPAPPPLDVKAREIAARGLEQHCAIGGVLAGARFNESDVRVELPGQRRKHNRAAG